MTNGARHHLLRRLIPAEFHDPAGLAGRMLRSGNAAARWALLLTGLRLATLPLDLLLAPFERRWQRRWHAGRLPVVLIVGPPRSGTTLIYQVLARYLQVSYLDNFSALFPRAPIVTARLFGRLHKCPPGSFDNYYGQTAGLAGVNDGFHVWDRFLGSDRYRPAAQIAATERDELRRFVRAWHAAYRLPLLNKNNRNTACMTLLAESLEDVRFVVVRRNPRLIVQSLLHSRLVIQGDRSVGWGLGSQSSADRDAPLRDVDDVCQQVARILADYDRQRLALDPAQILEIDYEAFCDAPQDAVRRVAQWLPEAAWRDHAGFAELQPFAAVRREVLPALERDRVARYFPEEAGAQNQSPHDAATS